MSDYLKEHLRYEVTQLRHELGRLYTTGDQLDWNSFFAAFCQRAHNLIEFFKTGHSNAKATEYIKGYKPPDRDHLRGSLRKLDQQVRHISKERTADPAQKFNRDNAAAVSNWIESALADFTSKLLPPFPRDWLPPNPAVVNVRHSVPGQSSFPTKSSSSPTMTTLGKTFTARTVAFRGIPKKDDPKPQS